MSQRIWTALLMAAVAQSASVAQKSPPPPPPPPAPIYNSPSLPSTMDNLETDTSKLQRLMDEERMLTPEPATKAVTIAELEKTLDVNRTSGDAKLAAILSGLSLTERVSPVRLSHWKAAFPGNKTRQMFTALADGSAFMSLPAEDTSHVPAPTIAEQRRIMVAFVQYLSKTLPSLPNFRATRNTTFFEDHPPRDLPLVTDPAAIASLQNRPMHVVGTSSIQVAYIDGHEMTEKKSAYVDPEIERSRFRTAGEFGPIIYGVMMDAMQSKLTWARWEPGIDGALAVFGFDATKEKSHFSLKPPGAPGSKNQFVAYRGEIAVNPSDGTIVRLSVIAHPEPNDATAVADIEVEYAHVEIGTQAYVCPAHAVALSKVPFHAPKPAKPDKPVALQTQINDVEFDQYHVFRGDPHILQGFTQEQP